MSGAVLVVGAAGAIGSAIARAFVDDGAEVHGWDVKAGPEKDLRWLEVDVTDWVEVHAAAAALPPLVAVVNSAGTASREAAADLTRDEWERVLAVNLSAPFYVAHAVRPNLADAKGTLINVASITASVGFLNRSAYSTTKAGLVALGRSLAIEWADDGVRVVTVSPTFVRTPHVQAGIDEGKTAEQAIIDRTPQHRMIEPSEVGRAVCALASGTFACVTGSEILLDAGFAAFGGF
jgi:3-oxoacyl-[acyl-carrier protein] reductase